MRLTGRGSTERFLTTKGLETYNIMYFCADAR